MVRYFIRTVEADAVADGSRETAALLERLLAYPDVRPLLKTPMVEAPGGPVLPMHFRKDQVALNLFTTLTNLGAPRISHSRTSH